MPSTPTRQPGKEPSPDIDAALRALLARTPRGVTLTQAQIAEECGCSPAYIYWLERSAKEKLRRSALRDWL